jgi:putative ABC transport system permease protein
MSNTFASTFTTIRADLRYALRGLAKAPGFTATVVLTLGLGLGAVTTMLAIVDSVLLRPVPLPHPEQLVLMSGRNDHDSTTYNLTYPQIDELRRDDHSLASISGYNVLPKPVATATEGARVALLTEVTPQFFSTLGVHARLGRLIGDADRNAPVAVVGETFWQDRLHRDPNVLGSVLRVSGQSRTIIGVLPAEVHFPQGTGSADVYTPISLNGKGEDDLFNGSAMVLARLKPGVPLAQGRTEANSIFLHSLTQTSDRHDSLQVQSYTEFVTGNVQTALMAFLGGVAVLLLIACANAANLQIARATGRMADMNIRSALGASFTRLVQQVVTESVAVSLLGAVLGSGLAYAAIAIIRRAYGHQFARFDELAVHPAALAACAALAVLSGVVAALAPVFNLRRQIGVTAQSANRTTRRSRIPGMLVALQIALTCVLLVTTALFVRTFRALQQVQLGFDPHNVTTLVLMPEDQHRDPDTLRQVNGNLLQRLQSLPGVESASLQSAVPFSNFNLSLNGTTDVEGREFHTGDSAFYSLVSSNFVHAARLPLLRGREFLPQDDSSPALVALVNQAFLKKYLPTGNPIGVSIKFHRDPGDKDSDMPFTQPMTIIGVVGNELQGGDLGAPLQPMVYIDFLQLPHGSLLTQIFNMASEIAVRSPLPQDALNRELRAALTQQAPELTEMGLLPMEQSIAQSLSERRLALRLVAAFGIVALILAAIGIYGVLAYSVEQRRKEIGIRMALGSSRAGVTRLVARQAGTMVLCGLVVGAIAAWPVGRAVKSFLFGVKDLDALSLATAGAVLLLVCALASTIPAWRAAQVDPMEALRSE